MATLIPSLGSARFDSRGELRLAERLKDFLEDNACIWHNLPMGPRGRHSDFVIVHPSNGLLVLEVKDWRLDTIASADWVLDLGPGGGDAGGRVVAHGTPSEIATAPGSATAPYLARRLAGS